MRILYIIALLLFFCSCDNISENDRFIEVEQVKANKCVLLEDYTGQRCINCPSAANEAASLKEQYGDKFIVVSIHAGGYALPTLSTPVGEEYDKHFAIESYPTGIIDRKSILTAYQQWGASVRERVQVEPPVDITLGTTYDNEIREVTINSRIRGVKQVSSAKLQLWLVESGIKAVQLMPDGSTNPNYIHNHVLRDAVNGTWGEDVSVQIGEEKDFIHTYTLKEKWIPENMDVVAFVYTSNEILQAQEASVIEE